MPKPSKTNGSPLSCIIFHRFDFRGLSTINYIYSLYIILHKIHKKKLMATYSNSICGFFSSVNSHCRFFMSWFLRVSTAKAEGPQPSPSVLSSSKAVPGCPWITCRLWFPVTKKLQGTKSLDFCSFRISHVEFRMIQ